MTWETCDDGSLSVCVDVLAEAFSSEPTTLRFCGPDERKRIAWFDALLRTHLTLPGQRTLVTDSGRPIGIAVTTLPGAQPTLAAQVAWTWRVLRRCGPGTLSRTVAYIEMTDRWKPADAWTLEFVGVLPAGRQRGIARHLFDRAQSSHPAAPAFLTTADARNVALYERWGFVVTNEECVAGLRVVGMIRPPRSPIIEEVV